jgi:exoribonuclease R
MPTPNGRNAKEILERIARRAMQEYGFLPDFSIAALDELAKIQKVDRGAEAATKDLRHLLWASIDNDDSRDLDQLTVAESGQDNAVRILVAVADVDAAPSIVQRRVV